MTANIKTKQNQAVWRIDVSDRSLSIEPIPEKWRALGGRALIARILLDEVDPQCEPLESKNKLIISPGLLVGHMLSSCDRISFGAKSPLTKGVKEANAGGITGLHMAKLGIKALIVSGLPTIDNWWVLYLNREGAMFHKADKLVDLGIYKTAEHLISEYGKNVAISLIGPAGVMGLTAAGIQNLDKDRVPSRIAARGGLGAVMGSKKLKAIVFDDDGCDAPQIVDPEGFRIARKTYNNAVQDHPQTTIYKDYGTAAMTRMCNGFGGLPTKNFRFGQYENAEKISGEFLRNILTTRTGECEISHACMPGCTIKSSNVYCDDHGEMLVSPIEYETIGLLGSNLCIDDLDTIAKLNWEINDIGLDSIEMGAGLGLLAEIGMMEFGDSEKASMLLGEIRRGSGIGRILGHGAAMVGDMYSIERVPVVKRQAISAYDPRAIKGTGVTYATSPQGADHTCGLTIRAKIDHLDPTIQEDVSRKAQINMAGYDTLGACIFAGFGFSLAPHLVSEFLNARYGWNTGESILQDLGRECLSLEREFNLKAGFTSRDDRLPVWMTNEPLPPHDSVFDVPDETLDGIFNW